MVQVWRCARCGDVLGVYEPIVAVEDGRARHTSRAAEPHLPDLEGARYHRACYLAAQAALPGGAQADALIEGNAG